MRYRRSVSSQSMWAAAVQGNDLSGMNVKSYYDADGKELTTGDTVQILSIPEELIRNLPSEDKVAISRQLGCRLEIHGFDNYGNAEFVFMAQDEIWHTIWLSTLCVRQSDSRGQSN